MPQINPIIPILLSIPILITIFTTAYNYSSKYRHAKFLLLAWISYFAWTMTNAFAVAFTDPVLIYICNYLTIPLGYFVILFFDSITQPSFNVLRLNIITAFSICKIVFSFLPDALVKVIENGEIYYSYNFPLLICGSTFILYIGLSFFYYMIRINLKAPAFLKLSSRLNVLGAFFIGILEPLSNLFNWSPNLPFFQGIGLLIIGINFSYKPQLAFILPFKAHSLIIMEKTSGVPIYAYTWDNAFKNGVESDLFSSMLSGISGLLRECFDKGELKEIVMENGVLLICLKNNFASVIIASKKDPSLRIALENFHADFLVKFAVLLNDYNQSRNFQNINLLIHEHFSFIPSKMEIKKERKELPFIVTLDNPKCLSQE